jgi:DeoR family fructose operon transcriptional repressor
MTPKGKERQGTICNYIKTNGYASVTELAELLRVSQSTIKRDLDELDQKKQVQRTHGGALSGSGGMTPPYAYRVKAAKSEKFRIAKSASLLIVEGDTLFIDGGSTTFALYQQITAQKVTVFTNSLTVLTTYNPCIAHVYALEGESLCKSMILHGSLSVENLERIRPDKIFLSSRGLSSDYQLLDKYDAGSVFIRRLLRMPAEKILLLDSTKFNATGTFKSAPVDWVDMLITDSGISQADTDAIRERGIKLVIV